MENIPRRNRLDLCKPSELAIVTAVEQVEKMGASVKLTDAVTKLNEARELVADFIDQQIAEDWRVKSFNDACDRLGLDPNSILTAADTPDEAAYKKLKVIAKAINNGWEPNWDDTDEKKWWPWFNLSSGFGFSLSSYYYGRSYTTVGSRLCFESKEKSTYAAETFLSIYEELLTIKK
ncbi:hypothetical protein [Maribellus mangrovi]|uniref:hypothetical protein n=1 Tax=Maribellus mangrovi TaxID=3133146 RepID=UPI0030EDACF8